MVACALTSQKKVDMDLGDPCITELSSWSELVPTQALLELVDGIDHPDQEHADENEGEKKWCRGCYQYRLQAKLKAR